MPVSPGEVSTQKRPMPMRPGGGGYADGSWSQRTAPKKGLRGFSRFPRGVCSQGDAESGGSGGCAMPVPAGAAALSVPLRAASGAGSGAGDASPRLLPPSLPPSLRPRPLAPPGPWAAAAAFSSPSSSSFPQVSGGDARGRGTRRDIALLALVGLGALRGCVGSGPPGRGSWGQPGCVQPGAARVRGYPQRRAPERPWPSGGFRGSSGSGKAPGGAASPAQGQTRWAKKRLAGPEPCLAG